MVARPGLHQANLSGGELDEDLHSRFDIKPFYSGAGTMTNIEPIAQGGFRQLPRTRKLARIRGSLTAAAVAAITDNSGNFDAPGTIYQIDFSSTAMIGAVAVTGFLATGLTAKIEAALQVEYYDGSTWLALGAAFRLTGAIRNIMRARVPGAPVAAEGVRVRLVITPGSTLALAVGGLTARVEGMAYGAVRHRSFTFDDDEAYIVVITAGHVDIFRDGVFVGAAMTGLAEADVLRIDVAQRFDTLMMFHINLRSWRLLRDASDDEWPWDDVPFTELPQVDYDGIYTNTVDQWTMYVQHPGGGRYGRIISLTINGEETSGVEVIDGAGNSNADIDDFCNSLEVAIDALPSVANGVTVVREQVTGTLFRVRIDFTGGTNEGAVFTLAAQVVSHTDSAATVGHTQIGEYGGEDLIGDARGWAACARFYQDRLFTGGFKSKRSALMASVTADYFNLNVKIAADTGGILNNIDTEGAERLQRLVQSKHLVLFTSDAEYYISDRTISRNSTPNIVRSSDNGSAPTVPIVSNEGELLYISKNRSVAYAATYSDISQSYDSEPISLTASKLVDEIHDAAIQRAEEETDAARYLLPRDDGTMTIGLLVRNQEISGFVRWVTDGGVKAIAVDGKNVPYLAIERQVNGAAVQFLEAFEGGLIFDCATDITLSPASTTVTGLNDYEGAEVWAVADGFTQGPFTVTGATIELGEAASNVTIGRWTPLVFKPLPIPRLKDERIVVERPMRVHTVRANLIGTTSIAVGGNGRPARDVALTRAGQVTDAPPAAFTGPISVTGIPGFTETGEIEITQVRPGRLHVRDFTREAKI